MKVSIAALLFLGLALALIDDASARRWLGWRRWRGRDWHRRRWDDEDYGRRWEDDDYGRRRQDDDYDHRRQGDDHGRYDAKCERRQAPLQRDGVNVACHYRCSGEEGRYGREDDGTPCLLPSRPEGVCYRGRCVPEKWYNRRDDEKNTDATDRPYPPTPEYDYNEYDDETSPTPPALPTTRTPPTPTPRVVTTKGNTRE